MWQCEGCEFELDEQVLNADSAKNLDLGNDVDDNAAVGGARRPHVSVGKCPGLVPVGRQVHCILFSCLIRVPALRSWCVIDVWTELLVLSIALTPKSLRSCLVVSVLSLSEPSGEQRSPDGSC